MTLAKSGALDAQPAIDNDGYNFRNHVTIEAEYEAPAIITLAFAKFGIVVFSVFIKCATSAKACFELKY